MNSTLVESSSSSLSWFLACIKNFFGFFMMDINGVAFIKIGWQKGFLLHHNNHHHHCRRRRRFFVPRFSSIPRRGSPKGLVTWVNNLRAMLSRNKEEDNWMQILRDLLLRISSSFSFLSRRSQGRCCVSTRREIFLLFVAFSSISRVSRVIGENSWITGVECKLCHQDNRGCLSRLLLFDVTCWEAAQEVIWKVSGGFKILDSIQLKFHEHARIYFKS